MGSEGLQLLARWFSGVYCSFVSCEAFGFEGTSGCARERNTSFSRVPEGSTTEKVDRAWREIRMGGVAQYDLEGMSKLAFAPDGAVAFVFTEKRHSDVPKGDVPLRGLTALA